MIRPDAHHVWSGPELLKQDGWRLTAAHLLERDLVTLREWARGTEDPFSSLEASSLELPGFDTLAARARWALGPQGPGVAWLQGLPTDPSLGRLAYLALGCRLGEPLENYGRLYDVQDQGGSYLEQQIPVSQTRSETSFHTDSARRETLPSVVGLLCLQDAVGGDSQLASASKVHEQMHRQAPELLERLYRSFVRDIVTPGTERTSEALLANRFPVYEARHEGTALTFRYMRYWIEKGAERAGIELDPRDVEAMDLLDSLFAESSLHARFHLRPGDALFIDNRDIAHNRLPYEDLPGQRRHLVRMWLKGERAA